jgi:hypothetical protein
MVKVQSSKFEVEKSTEKNNFELWKLNMQDLLVQQGFQKAFLGKSKKPKSMKDEDWEDLDARTLNTIRLFLADEVFSNIDGEERTRGLWNRLDSLYMKISLMNKIFLKRQLYILQMKEGTKIIDHLNVFNTLISQLSSMDVNYKDEDKEITLLCSFSESWDHVITFMWFSSADDIDYDIVVGALFSEEMRRRSTKETSTVEEMVVRGQSIERGKTKRGTSRSRSKGKKNKQKCWFCGKLGHLKKDCWKRHNAYKEDSTKEAKEAYLAETSSVSSSCMVDEVLSTYDVSRSGSGWD